MNGKKSQDERRGTLRRESERIAAETIRRQKMLFELGQIMTSEMDIEALFPLIIEQTNQVMNTEKASVFLIDSAGEKLWSMVSTDLKKDQVRIPKDRGVAGWVFQNRSPLIINDAYSDPRFLPEVDKKTGFKTRNILSIPLINREKKCIGTLQALNKKTGDFNKEDQAFLISASHYMAIAIENAKLYDDLRVLDLAKEKVINHLSHELRTPLAVIMAILSRVERELNEANISGLDNMLDRGRRNVKRLLDLQARIDDILNQKRVKEKEGILGLLQSAADLAWEFNESYRGEGAEVLEYICKRLEALFHKEEVHMEQIALTPFLSDVYERSIASMGQRELNITLDLDKDLSVYMDRNVLDKVFSGLLRNAIENTPDEGTIKIVARKKDDEIRVSFQDFGVGITPDNQQLIFGGFFHTQKTELYSSKRAYEFNAGGSGSDLLRTKCFSERLGFSLDFKSSRCKYIPKDEDLCPGRISKCQFIRDKSECLSSGQSTFSIVFPLKLQ
ncbi:MAG: GAF domain-containing sensor histidine kinase [Deltaproteobacteria bacterium]|nr:GAF domain-containing sensor histidine kinase [Deltaproteobacteria bacterium]